MHLCGLRVAHHPEKLVDWNDTVYALYGLIQAPAVQGWT